MQFYIITTIFHPAKEKKKGAVYIKGHTVMLQECVAKVQVP